ncbi:MAG: histidine phosphatase family protein, partial [Acidovorax sp.]|nr:histidine phosphatase family protein [Acidovorax sp.]
MANKIKYQFSKKKFTSVLGVANRAILGGEARHSALHGLRSWALRLQRPKISSFTQSAPFLHLVCRALRAHCFPRDFMHKLVLIRHGESTWNLENRFTGWTDVDLT